MIDPERILGETLVEAIRQVVRDELATHGAEPQPLNGKPKSKRPDAALNMTELAARLGCSSWTARQLVANGEIPSIMIARGRRKKLIVVRPEVLERWMKARERKGAGE